MPYRRTAASTIAPAAQNGPETTSDECKLAARRPIGPLAKVVADDTWRGSGNYSRAGVLTTLGAVQETTLGQVCSGKTTLG